MCMICAATSTFDPTRHMEDGVGLGDLGGPDLINVNETTDAPLSTTTPYSLGVGDTFTGTLVSGDTGDAVAISVVAGQTYTVNLTATSGTLDPLLEVYSSTGSFLTLDDDGGSGSNSSITFTAYEDTTYYFVAYSYEGATTGNYTMSLTTGTPNSEGTLDQLADYLTDGYWNENGGAQHSFNTAVNNEISVNITGLTASGKQLARWAFEAWEAVADIDFVETSGSADITFDDNQDGAFASYNAIGSTTTSSTVNVGTSWLSTYGTTIGSYSLQTYIHEIGHALGLGHQGGYNSFAAYGFDDTYTNDSWQMSIMSYFSQTENANTSSSLSFLFGSMMADIVAIQNLYGAAGAGSATDGDTTWGANTNLGGFWSVVFGEMFDGNGSASVHPSNNMAFTIFDANGTDTLDLSTSTTNNRIDMRDETFSDVNGFINNIGIARDTVLENLIAGSGDDTITGNDAANVINSGNGEDVVESGGGADWVTGMGGTDSLLGEGGNDTLLGSSGDDTLRGGDDDDRLFGGTDNDSLFGDDGKDRISGNTGEDTIYGGDGDDILRGNGGMDTIYGEEGNDALVGGNLNDWLDGGIGNDRLNGGTGADYLYGREGNDTLDGSGGQDRLIGGDGDDSGIGGNGDDRFWGGAGNDIFTGDGGNDRGYGDAGNDSLRGGGGNDTLEGGSGYDTLNGGLNDDLLTGGGNADVFVFATGHGNDTITDFNAINGAEDIDLSAVSGLSSFADLSGLMTQVSSDVVIDTGGGNSITLLNVNLGDLDAGDFLF